MSHTPAVQTISKEATKSNSSNLSHSTNQRRNRTSDPSLTPFDKYLDLVKLTHHFKPKKQMRKIRDIMLKLEKLCCAEDVHLRNALRYAKKLLNKQSQHNGK
jgi:hypothetical protein